MNKEIALIGNPNSGKTTLFNTLTGTYQKTGNWTGVTTEKKEGYYRKDKRIKIVDLPGIYSISSGIAEEQVVISYLRNNRPNVIINIVDGTNLERNLYLTLELLELGIPMVIAVNMYDDLLKNNIKLNVEIMQKVLGVKIVPVSALKNVNVDLLIKEINDNIKSPQGLNLSEFKGKEKFDARYSFIEKHIKSFLVKKTTKAERITQKIDSICTNKFLALPIFLSVITLVYFLSINLGGILSGYIENLFANLSGLIRNFLYKNSSFEWVISLFCDAVINGLGTVISFLPQILILFALMTIIEQSGYASRIAFILDRMFKGIGLSGKSVIPLIVSCGCTVNGLMATRTIENEKERKCTIYLAPFMPCGAKMAVFAFFAYKFFNGRAIVATAMYLLSIITIAISGLILKRFKSFYETEQGFILEMPTYRVPSFKDVFFVLKEKVKEFMLKAGSIILLVSVLLWILMNFGFSGYTNGNVGNSFVYNIGNIVKYIFYPLGFGSWQASVSILTGLMAKEAVIETLEITGATAIFSNRFSAFSFMAFVLLSPPCVASIATAKRELNDRKSLCFMLLFQTIVGYIIALLINFVGFLVNNGLILCSIIVIITISIVFFTIKILKKRKCRLCKVCVKGDKKCQKTAERSMI